jgi:hypothetical protein
VHRSDLESTSTDAAVLFAERLHQKREERGEEKLSKGDTATATGQQDKEKKRRRHKQASNSELF